MKKFTLLPLLLLPFFLMTCNDDDGICVRGSGTLNTYDDISVAPFDGVSVSGPVNINITQGAVQDVVIRAEPEVYDRLVYEVSGDVLEVRFLRGECVDTDLGVELDITIPELTSIDVAGRSTIRTINNIEFDNLTIDISGEVTMEMNGAVPDMTLRCSGVLDAQNFGLNTAVQNIVISGQAYVELTCSLDLDLIISGDAEIHYMGNPQISQNVSGSLTLVDAN